MTTTSNHIPNLAVALKQNGLRPTKQRSCVYQVIIAKRDHPTADDILLRVKEKLPTISFATVYNCLETLVGCGLVKQVNLDRSPARYCPNLQPHAHFKCKETGQIHDLPLSEKNLNNLKSILPTGFDAENFDLSFIGKSPTKINH
tara:strand:+ start:1371 stop:1805 length:435 start_codon:yes stop_codon:yes gene_type:complete